LETIEPRCELIQDITHCPCLSHSIWWKTTYIPENIPVYEWLEIYKDL